MGVYHKTNIFEGDPSIFVIL